MFSAAFCILLKGFLVRHGLVFRFNMVFSFLFLQFTFILMRCQNWYKVFSELKWHEVAIYFILSTVLQAATQLELGSSWRDTHHSI